MSLWQIVTIAGVFFGQHSRSSRRENHMVRMVVLLAVIIVANNSMGQDHVNGPQRFIGTWAGRAVEAPKVPARFKISRCGSKFCASMDEPITKGIFLYDFEDCTNESPPSLCNGVVCPPFKGKCYGDDIENSVKRCIMRLVMAGDSITLVSECLKNGVREKEVEGTFTRQR